jgi:hypothetical protein
MTFEQFLKQKQEKKFEQLQIQLEMPSYIQQEEREPEPVKRGITVINLYGEED